METTVSCGDGDAGHNKWACVLDSELSLLPQKKVAPILSGRSHLACRAACQQSAPPREAAAPPDMVPPGLAFQRGQANYKNVTLVTV
jgi:hypothetical protein